MSLNITEWQRLQSHLATTFFKISKKQNKEKVRILSCKLCNIIIGINGEQQLLIIINEVAEVILQIWMHINEISCK